METASGTSLAINLAEVAEAVAWVAYAAERLSHTEPNTPSQTSFPCATRWFLNIWAAETQCGIAALDTQECQTHPACVPVVRNQFKAVKPVRLPWHHKDRA